MVGTGCWFDAGVVVYLGVLWLLRVMWCLWLVVSLVRDACVLCCF